MVSTAPASPVHIGRYELLGVIGTGGMGRIHLARVSGEGGFEREVALKVLHPHLLAEEEFVAMFLDEARLAARIRHPNVVSTLDVQKTHDALFLVMDLVEGLSLSDLVKRRRIRHTATEEPPSSDTGSLGPSHGTASERRSEPLPVPIACRIAIDMLKGLQAAHQLTDRQGAPLNLVHRDISPGNVLIGKDGITRITDFGIARAETRMTATMGGQIKGKLPYMPPEQLMADNVDQRADVYAAGVVLWEMLTGRRLFRNKNQGALIKEILRGAQVRPGEYRPGIPRALDKICMQALAIDLESRIGTAAEFASEIKAAIRGIGRRGGSSEDVAALVAKYQTNLEHMDDARKSAPSVSGVDLISLGTGSIPSFTPSSFTGQPSLTSSTLPATPPPLSAAEPTTGADSVSVPPGPSSNTSSASITLGSGTLPGVPAADAQSKGARTLFVALAAAVVGGGIAIVASRGGGDQVSESRVNGPAVTAATQRAEVVPAEPTAPPPQPKEPNTSDETPAEASTAEPAEEAPPVRQRRWRPPRRSRPASKPTTQAEPPALSEQLPTEL